MPAAEAQLSVVVKRKGGNYGKPHPVEMMKGQNLPQTAYFLPQQLPVCLTQTPIWSKESHSPPPASARGLLVCSPGLGILHWGLVRISQLYSGLCQSWPVRNERELLRSETLRKAICIDSHHERAMRTLYFFPILTISNKIHGERGYAAKAGKSCTTATRKARHKLSHPVPFLNSDLALYQPSFFQAYEVTNSP